MRRVQFTICNQACLVMPRGAENYKLHSKNINVDSTMDILDISLLRGLFNNSYNKS